jgi:hypothetical protein
VLLIKINYKTFGEKFNKIKNPEREGVEALVGMGQEKRK